MARDNTQLSNKLQGQGAPSTALVLKERAAKWFGTNLPRLQQLMGTKQEATRLYLVALDCVSRNPKLLQCDPSSIFAALLQCAELKLYPGPLQQAALVPYGNKCVMMPQFQGLLDLAYRAGFIKPPTIAEVVYSKDEFEYQKGDSPYIKHIPTEDDDRGEPTGVYVVLATANGDKIREYFPIKRILGYRKFAKTGDFWDSPNQETREWMWKKTALKQALKLVPKSADLARALEVDNEGENPDLAKAVVVDLEPAEAQASSDVSASEESQDAP